MDRNTQAFLEAASEIGTAVEDPHWVTAGLVSAIAQTGSPVGVLTVDELRQLIRAHGERTNAMLGEAAC